MPLNQSILTETIGKDLQMNVFAGPIHGKNIKINIGRITVLIVSLLNEDVYLSEKYKDFLCNNDNITDIVLYVDKYDGSILEQAHIKKVYSSNLMNIYKDNKIFFLSFAKPSLSVGIPYPLMMINYSQKTSILYTSLKNMKGYEQHPIYIQDFLLEFLIGGLLSYFGKGIMLHCSGIENSGRGMIFVGKSNSGKSTMAHLWKNELGTKILNEESVIVRKIYDQFFIYGTPWRSELYFANSHLCPLSKILFIRHSEFNDIEEKNIYESLASLWNNIWNLIADVVMEENTFSFIIDLISTIPCYNLGFKNNKEVVYFLREYDI